MTARSKSAPVQELGGGVGGSHRAQRSCRLIDRLVVGDGEVIGRRTRGTRLLSGVVVVKALVALAEVSGAVIHMDNETVTVGAVISDAVELLDPGHGQDVCDGIRVHPDVAETFSMSDDIRASEPGIAVHLGVTVNRPHSFQEVCITIYVDCRLGVEEFPVLLHAVREPLRCRGASFVGGRWVR